MGDAQIGGNAGFHPPGKAAGAAGVGVGNPMNPLPDLSLPGGGIVHHKDLELPGKGGMGIKKGAALQHCQVSLQILLPAVGADYQSQAYGLGLFRLCTIGAGSQGAAPGDYPEGKLAFGAVCQGKGLFFPGGEGKIPPGNALLPPDFQFSCPLPFQLQIHPLQVGVGIPEGQVKQVHIGMGGQDAARGQREAAVLKPGRALHPVVQLPVCPYRVVPYHILSNHRLTPNLSAPAPGLPAAEATWGFPSPCAKVPGHHTR